MKVLYVVSGTGMAGGATKSLVSMISYVAEKGVEVEVVCPNGNGLAQWLREKGIKVYVARYGSVNLPAYRSVKDLIKWIPRYLYYSWINLRGRRAVKRIADASAPDIIHENSSVIDVGYHAARHIGVPDIIHIREFGPMDTSLYVPGRSKRLKDRNVYSIPITRAVAEFTGQSSNPKSRQIYDGIVRNSDFRTNWDKEKWFLYAGRIEAAKGISDLLEGYADYVDATKNPYPLYVCGGCGKPSYLEEMKKLAADRGIANLVVWLGERDDLADYMYRTAATVMPSRCEGLGRVMPEAMTNGALCVVRNITGTKEQLENGFRLTGAPIAIGYEEGKELTQALLDITAAMDRGNAFSEGSKYRQMIERSQDAVREFFTEEASGEKVFEFYQSIISNL